LQIGPSEGDPLVNAHFGSYVLLRQLCRGGTSEVYLAEHIEESRNRVAIKVLLPELSRDRRSRDAFAREFELLQECEGPGFPKAIRLGQVKGRSAYSMGLLEGHTVYERHVLGESFDRVTTFIGMAVLGRQVHRRSILHNDFKPENFIFGTADERPYLIDFGSATRSHRQGLTGRITRFLVRGRHRRGTLVYMAPELLAGRQPSERSDVYALGACGFFLFTGRAPISRAEAEARLAKGGRNSSGKDLPFRHPDLPQPFTEIVANCLSGDPEKRPADALGLYECLKHLFRSGDFPTPAELGAALTPPPKPALHRGSTG